MTTKEKSKFCYETLMTYVSDDNIAMYKAVLSDLHDMRTKCESYIRLSEEYMRESTKVAKNPNKEQLAELDAKCIKISEKRIQLISINGRIAESEAFYAVIKEFAELPKKERLVQISTAAINFSMYQVLMNNQNLQELYRGINASVKGKIASGVLRSLEKAVSEANGLIDIMDYLKSDCLAKRILTNNIPLDFINPSVQKP